MRTPLVVVTGVDPVAMDSALMSLAWDLPTAVSVRHHIDPHSQVLTRTVSDAGGVLEREEIRLEHACVACALREDVVPTLERLARDHRWSSIVAGLPTASEADQLTHVLARDTRLARHLRLSAVLAAVSGRDAVQDLLGDDLLRERGRQTGPGDDRGVGEVACAQVELADVVVLDSEAGPEARELLAALARPGSHVVTGADQLDGVALTDLRHQQGLAAAWRSPVSQADVPDLDGPHAWRVVLTSSRPFHPERLLDHVERLGTGAHRSRGCFWVPTRPGDLLEWSGAGGQLSVGAHGSWGRRTPLTRLVLTGLGEVPDDLTAAFEEILLDPAEELPHPRSRDVTQDGLEPWLGDIRDVA